MIGEIALFASSRIPEGWLPCRGQFISVHEYSELYAIIGHRYGGGLGTFRLPNLYDGPVENVQAYLREHDSNVVRSATNYRVEPRVYTEIRRDKNLVWMIQAKHEKLNPVQRNEVIAMIVSASDYRWVTAHSVSVEIIERWNARSSGALEIHTASIDIHSASLNIHSASVNSKSESWDSASGWSGDYSASVAWSASHAWSWITDNSSSISRSIGFGHSHDNKSTLDQITTGSLQNWNKTTEIINFSSSLWTKTYLVVSSSSLWPTQSY